MDEVDKSYRLFGLVKPASEARIKQAYRDLVKLWHPDRFGHDESLRSEAEEKLKEINRAYKILLSSLAMDGATVDPGPTSTAPTGDGAPPVDPAESPEPQDPEIDAAEPVGPGFSTWVRAAMVLSLFLLATGGWWMLRSQDNTSRGSSTGKSAVITNQSATAQPVTLPPGKLVASYVYTAADDFIVDVFHNGKRVADSQRQMAEERYGATAEKITVDVHEGDWLVFNVVNNRLRWDGARYFGAAGVKTNGTIMFQSDLHSGRWSFCDDPGDVPRFIKESDFMASNQARVISRPWEYGIKMMRARVPDWSGLPIWGTNRNTWIKYRALRETPVK